MNGISIRAENLSKAYRIGLREQRHETFMGALASFLRAPLRNFRELRSLSRFDEAALSTGVRRTNEMPSRSNNGGMSSPERLNVIWALKAVSFEVKHGEAIGIIGRNGAGKSTLLKILARITEPTTGQAEIHGRVGSLLEVGTGFHPDLTGRENIYLNGTILGMKKREIDRKFDEIVDFSGVEKFIDTPVKRYSNGMRVRLAFSVAAHLEPEILLVDEVLAVGDAEFQRKCLGKMGEVTQGGRTVLFVSHQMEAILNLCPRCLVLGEGGVIFSGPAEEAVRVYLESFGRGAANAPGRRHVLYESDPVDVKPLPRIFRIELLDDAFSPKPVVHTWDDVVFRVHYVAEEPCRRASFVLDICDYRQQRLLVLDSGLRFPIEKGRHYVDCRLPRLPLAAGDYVLGAGLAVSNAQWLWRNGNVALLNVCGKDVFELSRSPSSREQGFALKSIFAAPYEWMARPEVIDACRVPYA